MAERENSGREDLNLRDLIRPSASVSPDAPAREALKLLLEYKIPGLPVVDGEGRPVGFISDGNLLESALPQYLKMMEDLSFVRETDDEWVHYLAEAADRPVREVMSEKVATVDVDTSELEAAREMVAEGVSSVVVTENGRMIGMVSRLDLYAAIIGLKEA
ncbi:membrane protein [Rubrobacter xylanophilus]|uniref:Membrane protein n=1 Tax=Rubrobacter xylanophilus TaxID=49319 RepID=A0A510HET3_9ACTN|nr:CBS domain-containing protein [Rubrobacter xylanophilus]BBL78461.1 membrane protein [Rubrobacter xylanophilus]